MQRTVRRFRFSRGKIGRSLARDERGVTAIEFALVALPFFTLLFGIFEIGLAHTVNRMLDNAVVEAARLIRTGQAQSGNITAAAFKTRLCNFMPSSMCNEDRITVEVQSIEDFADAGDTDDLYDDEGNLREDLAYNIGGASEIVVVNVIYKWPMITSVLRFDNGDHGNERHLTSTMVFRNEPWE